MVSSHFSKRLSQCGQQQRKAFQALLWPLYAHACTLIPIHNTQTHKREEIKRAEKGKELLEEQDDR